MFFTFLIVEINVVENKLVIALKQDISNTQKVLLTILSDDFIFVSLVYTLFEFV